MNPLTKHKIINNLKIIILSLIITLGVSYTYAEWSNPTAVAPGGNTDAPINVGPVEQVKSGGFGAANIISGGLLKGVSFQMTGGNPGPNKVLVATSTSGGAVWKDLSEIGGSASRVLLEYPIVLVDECPKYASDGDNCYGGDEKDSTVGPFSGTIQAGTTLGILSNAKEILISGHIDSQTDICNNDNCYRTPNNVAFIKYKHSNWTRWNDLVISYANALYPNSNSVWLPLDKDGKLMWWMSSIRNPQVFRLEILGYSI